jgi:triacylglycerol lipase
VLPSDVVIEDYPVSNQPASRIVAREIAAMAATSLLLPFGIRRQRKRTARRADQHTIVLVHGYMANRATLLPLAAYLKLRGIGPVHAFDYPSADGIERAAIALRDHLRATVRGGRISLVCHSMGGVVARVYLQELGGARRVDRCITLGTPHRGTYSAYWAPSRVGRELRPDSPIMRRLEASRAGAARVKLTSIVAGSDNIIVPRVFAADEEDVVHVPHLGHVGMLFSPTVFRAVAERLRAAADG